MPFLASALTQHDLLCFARIVMKLVTLDRPPAEMVDALHEMEMLVAARLKVASTTWVTVSVISMCICCLAFFTTTLDWFIQTQSEGSLPDMTASHVVTLVSVSFFFWGTGSPLA